MATKREIPTTTTRDEWNGHPLLGFKGAFKPFRLNPNKCRAILEKIEEMRSFVADHPEDEKLSIDIQEAISQ